MGREAAHSALLFPAEPSAINRLCDGDGVGIGLGGTQYQFWHTLVEDPNCTALYPDLKFQVLVTGIISSSMFLKGQF